MAAWGLLETVGKSIFMKSLHLWRIVEQGLKFIKLLDLPIAKS